MNKDAYGIAFANHRKQLFEDGLFHSAILELMKHENIEEKDYVSTIAQCCKVADIYKKELVDLRAKS